MKAADLRLTRWNSAEYLRNESDIVDYLEAAFQEGGADPAYMEYVMKTVEQARNRIQADKELFADLVMRNRAAHLLTQAEKLIAEAMKCIWGASGDVDEREWRRAEKAWLVLAGDAEKSTEHYRLEKA